MRAAREPERGRRDRLDRRQPRSGAPRARADRLPGRSTGPTRAIAWCPACRRSRSSRATTTRLRRSRSGSAEAVDLAEPAEERPRSTTPTANFPTRRRSCSPTSRARRSGADAPAAKPDEIAAAMHFAPFPEYDISLSLELDPKIVIDEPTDLADLDPTEFTPNAPPNLEGLNAEVKESRLLFRQRPVRHRSSRHQPVARAARSRACRPIRT